MYKTMEQIREEYDGQWVYVVNCVEGERFTTIGGVVAAHNEQRELFFKDIFNIDYAEGQTLIFYAGQPPEGMNFLL
jgi:hypothetical protein